ncbi:MAG TPA: hypothetical protein VHE78_14710 [Gemmatimonadaceae bacterium]|nr:hypothetical protein [Gemmatimonadaceae bacterium]
MKNLGSVVMSGRAILRLLGRRGPATLAGFAVAACGAGGDVAGPRPVSQVSFTAVTAGAFHTCGVTTSRAAYCWGANFTGELGDGTTTPRTNPVLVLGGLNFAQVSAGDDQNGNHTCAVTTAGAASCWGNGYSSGTGPVLVAGGLSFAQVSAGAEHTCAVTTGGAAYCWGSNRSGALGDGTTTDRSSPVSVMGGLGFVQVSAGRLPFGGHTCGMTTAGGGYCWGSNFAGELGDGTTTDRRAPVAVMGGLTFRSLTAGSAHSCGVTGSGAAYCWGLDESGQLGDGSTMTSRSTPVPVLGGLSFVQVSAGADHTCGVTTSGAAYCWGANTVGQLGDGTTIARVGPVPVAGRLTFTSLATGSFHTCAVTSSGPAYCWGLNLSGTLGDGTHTTRTSPVPVVQ